MRALTTFVALFVVGAFTAGACSSGAVKVKDAGNTNDAAQTGDQASTGDVDHAKDAPADIPDDAGFEPPANVTFPAAPETSCASAGDCELPPSACADPSCDSGICQGWQWVIYYDDPTCVGGKCKYTNRYFECSPSTVCSAGGCRFNGTASRLGDRPPQFGMHGSCAPAGGDTTSPSPHISSVVFGPGST